MRELGAILLLVTTLASVSHGVETHYGIGSMGSVANLGGMNMASPGDVKNLASSITGEAFKKAYAQNSGDGASGGVSVGPDFKNLFGAPPGPASHADENMLKRANDLKENYMSAFQSSLASAFNGYSTMGGATGMTKSDIDRTIAQLTGGPANGRPMNLPLNLNIPIGSVASAQPNQATGDLKNAAAGTGLGDVGAPATVVDENTFGTQAKEIMSESPMGFLGDLMKPEEKNPMKISGALKREIPSAVKRNSRVGWSDSSFEKQFGGWEGLDMSGLARSLGVQQVDPTTNIVTADQLVTAEEKMKSKAENMDVGATPLGGQSAASLLDDSKADSGKDASKPPTTAHATMSPSLIEVGVDESLDSTPATSLGENPTYDNIVKVVKHALGEMINAIPAVQDDMVHDSSGLKVLLEAKDQHNKQLQEELDGKRKELATFTDALDALRTAMESNDKAKHDHDQHVNLAEWMQDVAKGLASFKAEEKNVIDEAKKEVKDRPWLKKLEDNQAHLSDAMTKLVPLVLSLDQLQHLADLGDSKGGATRTVAVSSTTAGASPTPAPYPQHQGGLEGLLHREQKPAATATHKPAADEDLESMPPPTPSSFLAETGEVKDKVKAEDHQLEELAKLSHSSGGGISSGRNFRASRTGGNQG